MKFRLVALLALAAAATATARAGTLTVQVDGVKSAVGDIYVSVCDKKTFMGRTCPFSAIVHPAPNTVSVTFTNVPAGRYAVILFQDVTGNHDLNFSIFGPTEPTGVSGPRTLFPEFQKAGFDIGPAALTIKVAIK
jgi:uncharacterized protein (DUF2141 family)